jgi:aminoglycoside phosphotransferase family enzyme
MPESEHDRQRRHARLEQGEIDAQMRAGQAELEWDELRAEQRSTIERGIRFDELERRADERRLALDDRQQVLEDRERRGAVREADLDRREEWVGMRERAADQAEIDEAQRT